MEQETISTITDYMETNNMFSKCKTYYKLDFLIVSKHSIELANELLENPQEVIKLFQIVIQNRYDLAVQIIPYNIPNSETILINSIRNEHEGHLIKIKGQINTRSKVYPRAVLSKYECPSCGNIIKVMHADHLLKKPKSCGCGRKGAFRVLNTKYDNFISLKIDSLPETLKGSENPYELYSEVRGVLCENDFRLFLGNRCEFTGYISFKPKHSMQGTSVNFDYQFNILHYKQLVDFELDETISPEEQELFDRISSEKNPAKFIAKLVYPDIHGFTAAKEVSIYQQFCGTMIKNKRDFIHVLYFGDPGTCKSDMAMKTMALNPIHKVASGPNISSVGLTITAQKDDMTKMWQAKAGLLPRCNGGLVVIDEIEKMSDQDKKALHVPMELGFCTIDKAGINGQIRSNTSILATANQKSAKSVPKVSDNLDLPMAIIDRFDFIFLFRDKFSQQFDQKIASNIVDRNTFEKDIDTLGHFSYTFTYNNNTFSIYTITKYIYLCKKYTPNISVRCSKKVSLWYSAVRSVGSLPGYDNKKATPRTVESILRLARAITRAKKKDTVTQKEIDQALVYFDYSYNQKKIVEEEETQEPIHQPCHICGTTPSHDWGKQGKPICQNCNTHKEELK